MSFLVGMAQMSPKLADVRGNVERHLRIVETAREKHVDILLFPELSLTGRALGDRAVDCALTLDSPEFADLRRSSKELGIGVGLVERASDRVFRNAYLYLDGGTVLGLRPGLQLAVPLVQISRMASALEPVGIPVCGERRLVLGKPLCGQRVVCQTALWIRLLVVCLIAHVVFNS